MKQVSHLAYVESCSIMSFYVVENVTVAHKIPTKRQSVNDMSLVMSFIEKKHDI